MIPPFFYSLKIAKVVSFCRQARQIYWSHKQQEESTKHVGTSVNVWKLFIANCGDGPLDHIKASDPYELVSARMHADTKPLLPLTDERETVIQIQIMIHRVFGNPLQSLPKLDTGQKLSFIRFRPTAVEALTYRLAIAGDSPNQVG